MLNFSTASGSMSLQFAKEVMKDAQLKSKTLERTENDGTDLMEISNLHVEADSSCSPSTRVFAETVATKKEIKVKQEREREPQGWGLVQAVEHVCPPHWRQENLALFAWFPGIFAKTRT